MSLVAYARRTKHASNLLRLSAFQTIQDRWLGQYFPSKPAVIQFPVNDICNAQCVMCDIWKRKRDKEITPDELRTILQDPLFEKVRYVGMSGGEPTLRRDLSEIGRAMVETLPLLQGFGIITNAVRTETVTERTLQLAEVAKAGHVDFSAMVSLDGLRSDHDRNRGVAGNFDSAMKVIENLRRARVTVGIGCTLTPENCYGADDLLLWCETGDIQFWEFRLGVEIKRVYNEGYASRHKLAPEQRFHLITFFDKLAAHPKVSIPHRLFYRSLVGQLAYDLPRAAGCDWRSRGVTLDTRGNISYCSVESPILQSALDESAWAIYRRNLPIRREIIRTKCDSCQHDLTGVPPFRVAFREFKTTVVWPVFRHARRLVPQTAGVNVKATVNAPDREKPSSWRHVLITGWYGTETAGDKAILSELVTFVRSRSPECRITVTSLDKKVSQQTNKELAGLGDASVVDLHDAAGTELIDSCDAVLFGGGPLEEIPVLDRMLSVFVKANQRRKARIVFGCGVGPLHTERSRRIVGGILRLSTAGFVRDEESWDLAKQLGDTRGFGCACDPALGYISRWCEAQGLARRENGRPALVTLLRANTNEYVTDLRSNELDQRNQLVARQLAGIVSAASTGLNAKALLLPMHSLWVGGDDRMFSRLVARACSDRACVSVERRYLTLDQLLFAIHAGDVAVAMRYHGHLCCMALGVPFLSIDYTGEKGKVGGLLRRIDYQQWSEDWRAIDETRAAMRLATLYEERSQWSRYLSERTAELTGELERTYKSVFPE